MKTFSALSLLLISITSFAFEQRAELDFSSVYGGLNAGAYEVIVKLSSKVNLSKASIQTTLDRHDNDLTCTTSARFEVGEMHFSMRSTHQTWDRVKTQKIYGIVKHVVDGSHCDLSLENLKGSKTLYLVMSLNEGFIELPVAAPRGYANVAVWITPFTGYLKLETEIWEENGELILDPSLLLSEDKIYPANDYNASKLHYYLTARKQATTLSLGSGVVEFR